MRMYYYLRWQLCALVDTVCFFFLFSTPTRGLWQSTLWENIKAANTEWPEGKNLLTWNRIDFKIVQQPYRTSNNIGIYSKVYWHCLWWASGTRMNLSPSFLFNRLRWQWQSRHSAAGQVMILCWWMWQPWQGITRSWFHTEIFELC